MIINKKHLYAILDEFSEEGLQIVTMEECSELQKEISKMLRNKGDLNHVCEEMAHVLICIDALKFVYGISIDDIYSEILKKGGDAYEGENPNSAREAIFGTRKRPEFDSTASEPRAY